MLNKVSKIAYNEILKMLENKSKDIPVCAVIFKEDEIISIQTNKRERDNQVVAHAEILALNEANQKLNSWRLNDCSMYITLEPCPMCAWAIINSRIKNVYFGSYDLNYGAFGSKINLKTLANFNMNIIGGINEKDCDNVLLNYFKELR